MTTAPRALSPILLFVLISVAAFRPWPVHGQSADTPRLEKETRPGARAKARVLPVGVAVGTNGVPLADVTNPVARVRGEVEGKAFPSSLDPSADKPELTPQVLEALARAGIPLLVVQEDGTLSLPETGSDGGPPALDISTDALLKLRPGLDPASSGERAIPSLRSRMEWNAGQEAYDLRGIELGLPGSKNIWLIYEQDDDGRDTGGLRFKRTW